MTNIKHFTDDGYTGRNFNRPGFQAMLAEAEAGKIGTIIVKDMSRFGRNYLEVGFYTEILFPKKQIRFIAINNSVDSDKPQDNDFTPFLNIMNEWYAKDTSNKIKSIFLSRMSDGKRCSGSIPYGYNRLPEDKQTLVVDPVASQVVKHIFELAAEGLTPPAIARQLTEEKVLIPSAYTLQYHPEQCNRKAEYGCTSWNANTVREILSRQEYLGHTVLRKTIGTNFKTDERRFATDEERLVFEDTHEPIVDSELWEQAHRRLKHATRRIKEGTHQEECLLPGLVYCADCGSKMSYQTNYYKSGAPYHSFRCSSYGNRTVNCTIHHISDKVLYQLVLRSIQRLSSHITISIHSLPMKSEKCLLHLSLMPRFSKCLSKLEARIWCRKSKESECSPSGKAVPIRLVSGTMLLRHVNDASLQMSRCQKFWKQHISNPLSIKVKILSQMDLQCERIFTRCLILGI